jgi:glycosyltransferase involved in cell wall biosynthesis
MLCIVIPAWNEVESISPLHAEIVALAFERGYALEIIFIDDGSTDGTWAAIRKLTTSDPRVRGIRLRRQFGKAAALNAGFRAARGEIIVTLDADLQDDPREIPNLLAKMDEGFDVVSGWKKTRHDPWHKVWPSRVFNWLVSTLTGVKMHDHNCGMKSYRREIFDEVRLYGELHRFVPVLASARGFRVAEVEVNHRPRKFGHSKFGVARFVKGFLDLLTVKFLTGFGQRPQHLLGAIGLLFFFLGSLGLVYLGIYWVLRQANPEWQWEPLHNRPALLYSVASLLLGGQLMSIGFLAELITAYHGRDSDAYSIAERLNEPGDSVP